MDSFINEQIDIATLPKVETLVFQPLERKYFYVLIISRLIIMLALSLVFAVAMYQLGPEFPSIIRYLIGALLCLVLIWIVVLTIKGFQHKQYALRQNDLIYKTGWLWKDMTTVPFNRIQHVSIDQGPIERNFKLAKLKIYTAGGSSSDLTVPGLNPETAETLKEFITQKTRSYEEE